MGRSRINWSHDSAVVRRGLLSLAVLFGWLLTGLFSTSAVHGQSLTDYTAHPEFVDEAVPPNILFLVDLGNQTLAAAYSGLNHQYLISFKSGTATDGKYASNVTVNVANPAVSLVSADQAGNRIPTATTSTPSDLFDSNTSYYGMFDPLRCYALGTNEFVYGSVKTAVSDACGATHWDGNFMNWLIMRKKDVTYQTLIGGTGVPAQSNSDGSANRLDSDKTTGENGTNNSCGSNAKSCWRYVKFVPEATLNGRVPTASLPNPAVVATHDDMSLVPAGSGRFFGSGEGILYVNDNATPSPFDNAPGYQYKLSVNLLTEPDVPSGTGSYSDHCIQGQPGYAGHLVCYQRERSLGLFQTLNTDNMRVSVMFVNSGSGKAARVQHLFDAALNSSSYTGIRNEHIQTHSPLAEATYEALCYLRKSQGPCYNNSGSQAAGYTNATGVQGDGYYFVSLSRMVECCKSFILLISPGKATSDGNPPDLQIPFTNLIAPYNDGDGSLFAGTNVGTVSTGTDGDRLDDVAYYGKTHDLRGTLNGTQNVTFYAVNALGDASGGQLLASAAKWGGFQDQNSNGVPDPGSQTCTYPAGSTLGSGTSTSSPEWDSDADCIPDTYFEATTPGGLTNSIKKALSDILKQASSGTSISVLATSSTGEGSIYQAYFFPSEFEGLTKLTYNGYTQGLFVDAFGNIREDTNGDGRLILEDDYIVQTRFDPSTNEVKADRYQDLDGDGLADTTTPFETVGLRDVKPIWEAGRRLALTDPANRTIKTWIDKNNDKVVNSGEVVDFDLANQTDLAPYIRPGTAPFTADNIIKFIRGEQISGLRDRQMTIKNDSGGNALKVWKYGDPVHSTPTVIAGPKERHDLIYGDNSYQPFFQQYRSRRQVAFVGANDGMMHAFNAGFYHRGDDPGTSSEIEHGYFTRTPTDNSGGPLLGEELFAFIPQAALPHLPWLARTDYTHVYYVDLKPKVTDARVFTADADHPGGWGTILIGGMRLGGSCSACSSTKGAPPMTVTADFNNNGNTTDPGDTRTFYTEYFVLDVTNPESTSYGRLLWSFSHVDMGLSTSYPAIIRVNPSGQPKTDNSQAKWYMLVGAGPTGYDGSSLQTPKLFLVDLETGPGTNNGNVVTFATTDTKAFLGDVITVDADLDYRVDVAYMGNTIDNSASSPPTWRGKMYRLTTNSGDTNVTTWGYNSGSGRQPTVLLSEFTCSPTPTCTGSTKVGPVVASPTVTLGEAGELWVFFGTGRFFAQADKTNTDTQHFFGVKDAVLAGGCSQTTLTSCERKDLVNVSGATVCVVCTGDQVTGVGSVTTFEGSGTTSLVGLVASKNGWFTTLQATGTTAGERALSPPTLIGGTVFFTTFEPNADICTASGNGYLYALFYKTGSANKEAIIGTETVGSEERVKRVVELGTGLPSTMAIQVGAQGSGATGAGGGSGCSGRVTGFIQTNTGAVSKVCGKPALSSWSQYISWVNPRT